MKMILAKGMKKREIVGPFDMCISTNDLEVLVEELQTELVKRRAIGCSFGWIRGIPHEFACNLTSTQVEPWE